MAKNNFKRIAQKLRNSGFILHFAIFLYIGAIGTVVASINDSYTSFMGIQSYPISFTSDTPSQFEIALAYARQITAALMPQVIMTICMYVLIAYEPENKRERGIWVAALFFLLVSAYIDISTGYYYYIRPEYRETSFISIIMDANKRIYAMAALFWAIGVDTFLSEIGSAVCWGLLLEIYPDAFKQWAKVRGKKETPGQMMARDKKKSSGSRPAPPEGRVQPPQSRRSRPVS